MQLKRAPVAIHIKDLPLGVNIINPGKRMQIGKIICDYGKTFMVLGRTYAKNDKEKYYMTIDMGGKLYYVSEDTVVIDSKALSVLQRLFLSSTAQKRRLIKFLLNGCLT